MHGLSVDPSEAIARLDALAGSARLTAREADRCTRLADALRRPARVCLLGPARSDIGQVVRTLIGASDLTRAALPPATELKYGPALRTFVTLDDGCRLSQDGWPSVELLGRSPVFLQIEMPNVMLRAMSFLVLSLDPDPDMHRPALSWAAQRSEIAVWCTPRFGTSDALIWSCAPERLTHHAYLMETRPDTNAPRHAGTRDFAEILELPAFGPLGQEPDIEPLLTRLTADIEDARTADIDTAQVLVHRLNHLATDVAMSLPADEPALQGTPVPPGVAVELLPILSEPFLFLKRRARVLSEDLAWADAAEDWAAMALAHCVETAEGLRERATNWPDDIAAAGDLRALIDEVCDLSALLQIETGEEQAQSGAALLFQLRGAFERALAPKESQT